MPIKKVREGTECAIGEEQCGLGRVEDTGVWIWEFADAWTKCVL